MPRLEASAEQDSYGPNEAIAIRLRIENDGAEALDIPHPEGPGGLPIYRLTGPAYPEGRHFRGLPPGPPPPFTDPPPARLRLEPGVAWEGTIPLREDILPDQPGEYRLTATLDTKAQVFEAQERSFRIAPFAPALAQIGHGLPPLGAGEGVGALLQRTAQGGTIYSIRYHETRPGIRQVGELSPVARTPVPAAASDVIVQVRNGPFFAELLTWLFWREGREIVGLVETGQMPRLRSATDIGALIAPALKPVDGAAEVLHLSADRMELALARFTPDAAPVEAWRTRLPVPAHLAAAAIAPGAEAQRLVVAAAATAAGDIVVQPVRYGASTLPALPPFGGAGSVRPMADARPGLHIGPDGVGTFGLLVILANGALGLLEATIPAAAAAPTMLLTDFGALPGPAGSGAVLYSPDGAGRLARRDVAVLLRDGTLLHAKPGAGLTRALVQGPVLAPPLLAPGRDGPYVLMSDPRRGPFLEPL